MSFDKTERQYYEVIKKCKELFDKKNKDYGTAWRILRPSSITDQLYIKAQRIRSIQEKGTQLVADDIDSEFIGIINYSIIAIIQLELQPQAELELDFDLVSNLYNQQVEEAISLLRNKNHDYGEAWREMRITSMTDLILMKILRVKQIEDNMGKTIASEGIKANFQDMINYAIFCMIKSSQTT